MPHCLKVDMNCSVSLLMNFIKQGLRKIKVQNYFYFFIRSEIIKCVWEEIERKRENLSWQVHCVLWFVSIHAEAHAVMVFLVTLDICIKDKWQ